MGLGVRVSGLRFQGPGWTDEGSEGLICRACPAFRWVSEGSSWPYKACMSVLQQDWKLRALRYERLAEIGAVSGAQSMVKV